MDHESVPAPVLLTVQAAEQEEDDAWRFTASTRRTAGVITMRTVLYITACEREERYGASSATLTARERFDLKLVPRSVELVEVDEPVLLGGVIP